MTIRRIAPLFFLLTLLDCDGEDDDAACEPGEAPASVAVDNRSGGPIETITATACDGGEAYELTLPDGGIDFAEQATVELPGSGCWLLQWNGEECQNDPPHRTSTRVCSGEIYTWTVTIEDRVCDESGW